MNPDPVHFVKTQYLEPFIIQDEDSPLYGVLDKGLNCTLRYYIFDRGEIVSSWSKEDLIERYPASKPRAYTAVSSSLADNALMMANNPEYADDLEANDPANAAMLLNGNWLYCRDANGIWDRGTIQEVKSKDVPRSTKVCRAWDKANTTISTENSSYDPDYTASVKVAKCDSGNFYIYGDYILDNEQNQIGRFREKSGKRNEMILEQSLSDGDETTVILPLDPGAAGQIEMADHAKELQSHGLTVLKDPMPYNKSKVLRFEPFCAACHNGYVYFVADSFDSKVLAYLYLELENFDGDKNNGYKDDVVDATASAFNYVSRIRVNKPVVLPSIQSNTLLKTHRSRIR